MKIAVVLGAGASYDCWDEKFGAPNATDWRPPLVSEMFRRQSFWDLTGQYPLVRELVVDMAKMSDAGTLNLEERLRWYATHENEAVRRQFKWIPLFIRDAVAYCCEEYRKYAFTYSAMFQHLLNYSQADVLLITTNYDDLAESALKGLHPEFDFVKMSDYISEDAPCKLVKLHGSIDWAYPMASANVTDSKEWDVAFNEFQIEDIAANRDAIWKVPGTRTNAYRWFAERSPGENLPMFPALTAPLAGKTDADVLCPESHAAYAQSFLASADRILIAGTSGLDDDVVRLLERGITDRPERLYLVGRDRSDAEKTLANLVARGLTDWKTDRAVFASTRFADFVFGQEFKDFYG